MKVRRIRIMAIQERSLVIRWQTRRPAIWCPVCSAPGAMISPESAAAVSTQSIRAIYRGVESGEVHYVEGPEGLVICLTSLTDTHTAHRNERTTTPEGSDEPDIWRSERDLKGLKNVGKRMKRFLPIIIALPMLITLVRAQEKDLSPALSSLVAAERAFARTSVEKGIRESFLEFFADDGINFQPHPTKTREAILKRPAPATRPPVVLDWQPAYADVSGAGDLGYTTGPYTLTDHSPDPRPKRYGMYFSIWKKQIDGSWKVMVDAGIQTPDHSGHDFMFKPAPSSAYKNAPGKISQEALRNSLVSLDRDFLLASSSRGVALAYLDYLDPNSRLNRNGSFPIVGRDAIRSFLRSEAIELKWEPIASDVSQSGDLGYTYGSYELKHTAMNEVTPAEKGYYVRVWKRDAKGKWKLAFDTTSPIPDEKK